MRPIFAIGDIHGCYTKLRELVLKIPIDPERDTLVFLGDYIDRGPDSYEVVDYLISLQTQIKHVVFLKGNHEEMLDGYFSGTDPLTYLINGGEETLNCYRNHSPSPQGPLIPSEHLDFFRSLLLYWETENYIFVHAGLKDGIALEKQSPHDMLWIRNQFIHSDFNFGKPVIFGHTPFPQPFVRPNKIGIDTGAVYGNKLTCVQLPEIRFFQA